ncbi:unnamed protein product [Pseudo-nitzschia multistriata]|uniref:CCHC-type domain-containing protein n=1 Tax=Pseudo-nitzschia multistriata TaxID=183589 RepID=A0A448Z915_9STRA|nr:unnamed protein product [Pseudo-nitzschia multistriata]
MRLVTGDECGLLKEVIPELGRKKKNPNALIQPHSAMIDVTTTGMSRVDPKEPQKRVRGVVDMVWMEEGDDFNSSFSVLRKNGSVDLWTSNIEKKKSFGQYSLQHSTANNIFGTEDSPRPLGIGVFHEQNRLVAGDMLGNIAVLDTKNEDKYDIVQTYNSYTSNKGGSTISYTPGKMENVQLATAIAFDTARGRAALGGREREVCLTDISTGKLVFKTKNTPPDPQTLLQQPVWPTAIQFLNKDSNMMAVGTAYKQVRIYDVRENSKTRRPTSLTPEGLLDYRVTCLCQIDEHELVVGDASGDIHTIDIRKLDRRSKGPANKNLARYAGPAGSVRQLKKHPTLPRLTAVGLDRMLRVYDTNTRKQLDCVYLKQRLNCVLVHKNDNWASSDDGGVFSDDDYDADDVDIDQDDVVRDYVDSDDSDNDEGDSEVDSEEDSGAEDRPNDGGDSSDAEEGSFDEDSSEEEMGDEDDGDDSEESESEEEEEQHSGSPFRCFGSGRLIVRTTPTGAFKMALHESLTVLIQTSPIPSHPSTALLEALFRSFEKADGLLESRIVILADGCEALGHDGGSATPTESGKQATENIKHGRCYSRTAENYLRHLELLERAVREGTPPFCPRAGGSIELVRLESRHGSAPAIEAAMARCVSTPLVMICQHDNFFVNEAPLRGVVAALLEEPRGLGIDANCVHFLSTATLNYREKIQRRYKLDIGEPRRVKALEDPLVPLVFWYGRSHVAYSDYVRSHCLNRELARGSHLEELLGEKQLHDIVEVGMEAHKKYGTYVLDQGFEVLYHMSGRRVRAADPSDATENFGQKDSSIENKQQQQQQQHNHRQQQQQPLEGSFTTARETRARVPGLAFFAPDGEGAPRTTAPANRKPFKQRCFHCGEKGHSKKFCPKREVSSLRNDHAPEIIEL